MLLRRAMRVVLAIFICGCPFSSMMPAMAQVVVAPAPPGPVPPTNSPANQIAGTICQKDATSASASSSMIVVRAERLPPSTTTNVKTVVACSVNVFRYDGHLQSQKTTSNPQSPISGLGFPTNSGGAAGGAGGAAGAALLVPRAGDGVPAPPPPDTEGSLATAVLQLQLSAQQSAIDFTNAQTAATQKLACFNDIARRFPSVLLTQEQKRELLDALSDITSCASSGDPQLKTATVGSVSQQISATIALTTRLAQFQTTPAYNDWITGKATETGDPVPTGKTINTDALKTLYAGLLTANTATLTQLQGIINSTGVGTYNSNLQLIQDWDFRQSLIINGNAPWDQMLTLACHPQWFGKTDGDTVTLQYADLSATAPSMQPMALFTNSCLPPLTVTSGLGLSFVRSSTYAFEPKTDYTQNPPVTTQVIGYSANSRVTPLFVGQMNYAYLNKPVGLHISGGAGVSASSSGPSTDLFVGNAISFFHRAVFVTPSAHFTQRQELQSGYTVGNPMGTLTSVPTTNGWKTGFAVTITLPVLQ